MNQTERVTATREKPGPISHGQQLPPKPRGEIRYIRQPGSRRTVVVGRGDAQGLTRNTETNELLDWLGELEGGFDEEWDSLAGWSLASRRSKFHKKHKLGYNTPVKGRVRGKPYDPTDRSLVPEPDPLFVVVRDQADKSKAIVFDVVRQIALTKPISIEAAIRQRDAMDNLVQNLQKNSAEYNSAHDL